MTPSRALAVLLCVAGCAHAAPAAPHRPPALAEVASVAPTSTEALQTLVTLCALPVSACSPDADSACLAVMPAPQGGVAFRYRDHAQWDDEGRSPLPHFLVGSMRALRNAYGRAASGSHVEQGCGALLRSQLAYLRSTLRERDGALVWENEDGLAQAMEQAEWAHLLASIAGVLVEKNDLGSAAEITSVALAVAAALDRPARPMSGGVRSAESVCIDGALGEHACFWLCSRGVGLHTEGAEPRFVLNQHLHAVYDSLLLYDALAQAPGSDAQRRAQALQRAASGLVVLAYGPGWSAEDPGSVPNLEQLVDRGSAREGGHAWAHYEFDLRAGIGTDISTERTCHYHAHVLQKLADIALWIESDGHADAMDTVDGRWLRAAIRWILAPDGLAHALWRSEASRDLRHQRGCPLVARDAAAFSNRGFYLERFGAVP